MKSPKSKLTPTITKEPKVQVEPGNYKNHFPSWQIGLLDLESEWGLKFLDGKIKFSFSSELIAALDGHTEIFDVLDKLDGKEFTDINDFFSKLEYNIKKELTLSTINEILICTSRHIFNMEVYPKLKEFEKLTWHEIETQKYGYHGKTKSHSISVSDLKKEAQKRLKELKLDDIDELFSLRLDGKFRIYGIRKFSYLQIIWFDRDHTAYDFND